MDNDTPGSAQKTLDALSEWAPGLPVFGLLTPFPSTPLYDRLAADGRLFRPTHWLDFAPFKMAHTPLKMTIEEAQAEVKLAWEKSYSPERIAEALESIKDKRLGLRLFHFMARLTFRGIYFPQMGWGAWVKVFWQNRRVIWGFSKEGFRAWRTREKTPKTEVDIASVAIK
jgi:hypothetical protein